jgi:hypothetical protein
LSEREVAKFVMGSEYFHGFNPHRIFPKILSEELPENVLLLISPETCIGVAVVNRIRCGVVQATEFCGERILSVESRAIGYEIYSVERTFIEQRIDVQTCDVSSERLNVLVIDPRAVELIEDESLQNNLCSICVGRKVCAKFPESFFGYGELSAECGRFSFHDRGCGLPKHDSTIEREELEWRLPGQRAFGTRLQRARIKHRVVQRSAAAL